MYNGLKEIISGSAFSPLKELTRINKGHKKMKIFPRTHARRRRLGKKKKKKNKKRKFREDLFILLLFPSLHISLPLSNIHLNIFRSGLHDTILLKQLQQK